MQYLHVKNLEKYHPGYKDRSLSWCKAHFKMLNADPEFEMLPEIDRWRFMAFIMLELQIKRSIPLDPIYLTRKGFNLKNRPISLTLQMLHTLVEVRNESVTQIRAEKSREEKSKKGEKIRFCDTVYLSKEEHQELVRRYGAHAVGNLMEDLDNYIGSTGKKYKSHYKTLLAWAKKDKLKVLDSKPDKPDPIPERPAVSAEDAKRVSELVKEVAKKCDAKV